MNEEEYRAIMQHMKDSGFHRFEAYDKELQCLKDYFVKDHEEATRVDNARLRRSMNILQNALHDLLHLETEPGPLSARVNRLVALWESGQLPQDGVTGNMNDPLDIISSLRKELDIVTADRDEWRDRLKWKEYLDDNYS